MNAAKSLFLLLVLAGWLGLHGLAPSHLLACDSGNDAPAKGKTKGQ